MPAQSVSKKKIVTLLIALAIPAEASCSPLLQQLIEVKAALEAPIYIGVPFNITVLVTSHYPGEVRLLAAGVSFTWGVFEIPMENRPLEENETIAIYISGNTPDQIPPGVYRFRAHVKVAVLEGMRWRFLVIESELYSVKVEKIEGELMVNILSVSHSLPRSQEAYITLRLVNTGIKPNLSCKLSVYADTTIVYQEEIPWVPPGEDILMNVSATLPPITTGELEITALINYTLGTSMDSTRISIAVKEKFNATLALMIISEANRTYNLAFSAYIKLIQDNLSAIGADLLLAEASDMLIRAVALFNKRNATATFYANKSIAYSRDATLLVLLRYINATEDVIEKAGRKVETYRALGVRGEKMEEAYAIVKELKDELSKMRRYALLEMDVDKTRKAYQRVLTKATYIDQLISEATAEHIETRARSMTYILAQIILLIIILVFLGNRIRLIVIRVLFKTAAKKLGG